MAPGKTKQALSTAAPAAVGRPNAKASRRPTARGSSRTRLKVISLDPLRTLSLEAHQLT